MIDQIKERIKRVRPIDVSIGLALFFASLFFFYDLFVGRFILTERDLGAYFIPPRFFWVESIKMGQFPLWNPYQFSGHPFFANPQHAVIYPINLLFFVFPFDFAFNIIIILHFFLGGWFVYFLLKDLDVDPTGSLISGLIFMFGGYLLSVHSLLNNLLSVIWTPLIMLFFRRAMKSPGIKNEILTGIFIAISFLGGGIEIIYGNIFVLFFMLIFYSSSYPSLRNGKKPSKWRGAWFGIRSLLIVSIISLLLSAVQLVPFLELFHHSIRGGGITYQEATVWSFAPKDILLFFLPDAYGYFLDMKKYWINQCWFKTLYTGGLPFILAFFFFIFEKRRRFYFSLMFFSIFLSLGQFNPFYPYVFKYLPFFNGIRYPAKFLYIFILILSITAGLGFQRLMEFSKEDGHKRLKHILMILSLASCLFLLFLVIGHKSIEQFLKLKGVDFPDFNPLSMNLFHVKRFFFYLTLFFLLLRIGYGVRWKSWAKILLIFFLTADLFGNMGFYGKDNSLDFFKKTKILETISSDRENFRVFSTEKTISTDTPILIADASLLDIFKEKHFPSIDLIYRLHNIWGIDVIRLKRTDDLYKEFTSTPSISTTHLLDLYGVKYVISVTPIGDEDTRFELIYSRLEGLQGKKEYLLKGNTIKLYRNRQYPRRAWLVKNFRVMDAKTILSIMSDKSFNPLKEVLLEETPPSFIAQMSKVLSIEDKAHQKRESKGEDVKFILEKNDELHLKVRAEENALLVLSDTYYPGWKAFVNGKETKIYQANYNFRAIPLKAGDYRIKFIFNPTIFKIGAFISLFTLIGIIIYFIRRKRHVIKSPGH